MSYYHHYCIAAVLVQRSTTCGILEEFRREQLYTQKKLNSALYCGGSDPAIAFVSLPES